MKRINFWAFALTATMMAACADQDDIVVVQSPPQVNEEAEAPIVFSSSQRAFTRGDFEGAAAAEKLGNKFVVTGFKGSSTATPGSIVFDNFLVEYKANTANTTESNSRNWEYVGKGPIKHAQDNGITSQAIKYWDYTKDQYDFLAWSTGLNEPIYSGTPTGTQVLVTNIQPNSKEGDWTAASNEDPARIAYTMTGTAEALSQCYISDLVTVKKSSTTAGNKYGDYVTLKFRQLGTKVRIAIYETVPGYSVKNVEFYTAAAVALDNATKDKAHLFTTTANDIYRGGTYKIYFPTVDKESTDPEYADNNQAHIKFSGEGYTQDTKVNYGALNYTGREEAEGLTTNSYLGRTSNSASFAGTAANNYYDFFLPNENGTNLNLRVNYTLESIDGTKEEIYVKGATAQVPSIYTTWKPGYAYTYLFKISDKTNGHTGEYNPLFPDDVTVNSDPAGLYPITFDAMVVNAEDGNQTQETITLVSTPSITTYQNGSNVVNNNEYTVLTPSGKITGEIYVTVNDGEISYEAVTEGITVGTTSVEGYYTYNATDQKYEPATGTAQTGITYYRMKPIVENGALATLTDKVALYEVAEGTTEAEVIDALQYQEDDKGSATILGRNEVALTTSAAPNALSLTNEITYGADGNKITVSTNQAAKFIPKASTTYAFVYTKKAADATNDKPIYQQIAFDDATVTTKYRFKLNDVAAAGDVQKNVVYFAPDASNEDKLTKKSVFIGQGVDNLYTRSGTGPDYTYPQATGYAVTGTKYYYGSSHTEAHDVAYADFASAELYVKSGAYYVAKTETEPKDGTAYYYRTGTEDNYTYTYCVIFPEQATTEWKTLDTDNYVKVESEDEIIGMTYFDKYTQNDGVYYVKVIKVQ